MQECFADFFSCIVQAVQYVAPSQASQVVLESGTKSSDALPAALYGCPYPPSRNGGCRPPPTCNCYQVSISFSLLQGASGLCRLLNFCLQYTLVVRGCRKCSQFLTSTEWDWLLAEVVIGIEGILMFVYTVIVWASQVLLYRGCHW